MNNKKMLMVLSLVFVLMIGGAYVLYTQLGQQIRPEQLAVNENAQAEAAGENASGMQIPDFTVYDEAGNAVKLSDYIGKPLVLNFWASWCGPCQMEMPEFQEKYDQHGEEVTFLMVNMTDGSRETVEGASAFIREHGYDFPVLYDTESSAARNYGVYSLPTTYFINAECQAVTRAVGAIDAETLQQGIDMIHA